MLTFGLGEKTKADSIEVQWPSGQIDKLSNVSGSQTITIQEGKGVVANKAYSKSLDVSALLSRKSATSMQCRDSSNSGTSSSDFPLCTFVPFVVNLFLRMTKTISFVCAVVVLATIAIFAAVPQSAPGAKQADKSTEAARLNNLGVAYMNQQLFEKALKAFEQAAALDPNFQIAPMNQGIALLNLGRVDAARQFLEQAVKQNPDRSPCLVQPRHAGKELREFASRGRCLPPSY